MSKSLDDVPLKLLTEALQRLFRAVHGLIKRGREFRRLERRYLNALIKQCKGLPLRPPDFASNKLSGLRPMYLEQVYVEPIVTNPDPKAQAQEATALKKIPPDRTFWERLTGRKPRLPQPGEIGEMILATQRLVLRGAAGSGKSTILRYLAITCARALRKDRRDGDTPGLARKRLGWLGRVPFPILVQLEDVVQTTGWIKKRSLSRAIAEVMKRDRQLGNSVGEIVQFLDRKLDRGHCLVLLDDFDALVDEQTRWDMARAIGSWGGEKPSRTNWIVVTCRPDGYKGELSEFDFLVGDVEPFEEAEAEKFVRRRYEAVRGLSADSDPVRDLQDKLRAPGMQSLADNPLLLDLLFLLHLYDKELPSQKYLVYQECARALAEQRETDWREQREVLQTLALRMQEQLIQEGRAPLRWSEAREIVAGISGASEEKADSDLVLCVESGVLRFGPPWDRERTVVFSHAALRHFFVAQGVAADRNGWLGLLLEHASHPEWRDVALLYASMGEQPSAIVASLVRKPAATSDDILLAAQCAKTAADRQRLMPAVQAQIELIFSIT